MFFNAQRIKKMHKWDNISNGETRARFFKKKIKYHWEKQLQRFKRDRKQKREGKTYFFAFFITTLVYAFASNTSEMSPRNRVFSHLYFITLVLSLKSLSGIIFFPVLLVVRFRFSSIARCPTHKTCLYRLFIPESFFLLFNDF